MIRFCDKEVYNITDGEMTKEQLLSFFAGSEERKHSVIAVYSEKGSFQGIITYQGLQHKDDPYVFEDKGWITVSDRFWERAREYFRRFPDALLPVMDDKEQLIGFAFDDAQAYQEIEEGLRQLDSDRDYFAESYKKIRMIVITDLNELGWKCFLLFKEMGYEICVVGEKWEWFGYKSGAGYLRCPEYARLYIYAEGTGCTRTADEHQRMEERIIQEAFRPVIDINNDMMRRTYRATRERLQQKGVSVCECLIPTTAKYRTELEWRCAEKKVSLERYLDDRYEDKADIEKYLFEMYGEENIDAIRNGEGKGRCVPVGDHLGQTTLERTLRKRIYLIGPCIADGYGCRAMDSLGAQIQRSAEQYGYQVIAICIEMHDRRSWQLCSIETIPIRKKDIVLVIYNDKWFPGEKGQAQVPQVDLAPVYEDRGRDTMFCRMTLHTNAEGNRAIAGEIWERYLRDEIARLGKIKGDHFLQKGELLSAENISEIKEYTDKIQRGGSGRIGAIVMNCNPFTYGHRYLIEHAASQMDLLYVFVVEEDRSYFNFKDRSDMVQRGTQDLENVAVVPSGKWVLSYKTMPAYFRKEYEQDIRIDADLDLEIFCRYVAPALNIQKRFVGEEPFDKVTRQYNEQMEQVLGEFGIGFEEIPRRMYKGQPISASFVRKCMDDGEWALIRDLIPETSYQVCLKYQK